MNPPRESAHESFSGAAPLDAIFHLLAQPVMALRASVELGLSKPMNAAEARKTLENCLTLLDRLMQELAMVREISSLEPAPPLALCDVAVLLKGSAEEMAPVAEACGVALTVQVEAAELPCNGPMLQRALFLLLDSMIAGTPQSGSASIGLGRSEDAYRLELRPGTPPGGRRELCRKLLQAAGASGIELEPGRTLILFRSRTYRQDAEKTSVDKRVLISHSSSSKNGTV